MKHHVIMLLLILLPVMTMAQGKAYKAAASQFMQCYNASDPGCINGLLSQRSRVRGQYTRERIERLKDVYGNIRTVAFARQREDGLVIYTVKFVKPKHYDPGWIPATWLGIRMDEKKEKIVRLSFPVDAYLNGDQPTNFLKQ